MRRKSLLVTGMLLSIIYAICFTLSFAIGMISIIYFFVSDTIQIINDILLPIINPFMSYGKNIMLFIVALLIVYSLFLLICSTRFIKYYNSTQSKYNKKRGLLIFNLVFFILTFAMFCYLLMLTIFNNTFTSNLIYSICLIVVLVVHIIAIVFAIYGLINYPKTYEEPVMIKSNNVETDQNIDDEIEESPVESNQNYESNQTVQQPAIPPIYTAGLDGENDIKEKQQSENVSQKPSIQKPEKEMESLSTKKLIEAIGKLDQMRKDGEISTEEYTKLRTKMIKRFTK